MPAHPPSSSRTLQRWQGCSRRTQSGLSAGARTQVAAAAVMRGGARRCRQCGVGGGARRSRGGARSRAAPSRPRARAALRTSRRPPSRCASRSKPRGSASPPARTATARATSRVRRRLGACAWVHLPPRSGLGDGEARPRALARVEAQPDHVSVLRRLRLQRLHHRRRYAAPPEQKAREDGSGALPLHPCGAYASACKRARAAALYLAHTWGRARGGQGPDGARRSALAGPECTPSTS